MEGAHLAGAHLQNANFHWAKLQKANLDDAHLEGASLDDAHLEGASLEGAHLEGANLDDAHLEGASLHRVWLDGKSSLDDATLLERYDTRPLLARLFSSPRYGPALGDIHWGDFDIAGLTRLQGWDNFYRLADERGLTWRSSGYGYWGAARAYRQVAQRLRDQGYSDIADRLAERAQVLQRKLVSHQMLIDLRRPWRLPGDLLRWLFSWFLALLAGYGYHPGRSVFWYLATIVGFAFAYYHWGPAAGHAFQPDGAVVFSLISFYI